MPLDTGSYNDTSDPPFSTESRITPTSIHSVDSEFEYAAAGAEVKDILYYDASVPVLEKEPVGIVDQLAKSHGRSNSQPSQQLPSGITIPSRTSSQQQEERRERRANTMPSSVQSPTTIYESRFGSPDSYHTNATSLPPLQSKGYDDDEQLEPLKEEDIDPESFDLVAPAEDGVKRYNLETRSEQLLSTEHLQIIFSDPSLLLRFTAFLRLFRSSSIPILIYYLDAVKALKAISYSNAIAEALDPIRGLDFTNIAIKSTVNTDLEERAKQAFDIMVKEDLPAYITHVYIQTVSLSIQRRITGNLPIHLREACEGLAEVFCLTDPSRPDNPIVFASEQFHRTTQYGMNYVIGRNCRFLQGPKTDPSSVRRLQEKIQAGVEVCEVFLNYRRDGSPFMNLLMCAPLRDSRGTIRYFIGAQVDISGLVKSGSELESFQRLMKAEVARDNAEGVIEHENEETSPHKDEFQELSEMLNLQELDTVQRWGGKMHQELHDEPEQTTLKDGNWNKPRLLISSSSPDGTKDHMDYSRGGGRLNRIYENYLLVRPYPSLRILFASPSLRVPGILQSPFMNKIGGSPRVREELTAALADGRGVTAKIRWVSRTDAQGRPRWIHCTPLIGSNGAIGVWMIVIVDEENTSVGGGRRFREAVVDPQFGRGVPFNNGRDDASVRDFANRPTTRQTQRDNASLKSYAGNTERSGSPFTLRLG